MAENFLQMLMGMVDSYLVASLGLVAISGVSVANNILSIYQAIFIALGAASASLIARQVGAGNRAATRKQASEVIVVTLLLSFVLGLLSVFGGEWLLSLLGTEAAVAELGGTYLALVGGGTVFLGLMTSLGAVLRATGRSQLPMYVSLFSNVLNAALSALAVFVLGWGVVGVAVGTILSRLVGMLILASQIRDQIGPLTFGISKDLLRLALPAAGERLVMRAGDVVIVTLIVTLGTNVVAGNSIGETLTQFNYMPGMGIATATVILIAHAKGQGQLKSVQKIARASFILSLVLMLLVSGGIYLFGDQLTGFFTTDSLARSASLVVILYAFLGTPMTAGTLIYTAVWQGLGNARLPFYATFFGMWVIRIGLGYLLTAQLGLGVAGVWLATNMDNLFRWVLLFIIYKKKGKEFV